MRKIFIMLVQAVFCLSISVACASPQINKSKLRVLYVGGMSDWSPKNFLNVANPEEAYKKSVKERMDSFEKMLNTYFTSVTVIHADNYTQEMSDNYDVTVMDGQPKAIAPVFQDMEKGIYLKPAYFTENFDNAILTIGQLSDDLGRRVGTKNDWYCLCLDAHAFDWRKEHPVFQGPFEVKMTVITQPTPEQAFGYAYLHNAPIPQELPMWRVQTKGYATDEGFAIGLVSRAWGYEDSPEAEIISGGVSTKSLDAVAIGRHGNWLHWGFAASPLYLTDEAQAVLANAIVYISKFNKQGIIARKYSEGIATKETIGELKYMSSQEGYEGMLEAEAAANKMMLELKEKALAKKERGEKLDPTDEYMVNFTPRDPRSREEVLKLVMPTYFAMFGLDEKAYARYFDENYDYFYDGNGSRVLLVDEDAKSLGIPVNDIRLIHTAISLLEAKTDTEKAKRILNRYTLVDFPSAAAWREWFKANKENMFFTESGGWIWLINSREPGVNDYRIWETRRALNTMPAGETSDSKPVAVDVSLETLQSGEKAVYVRIKVHPGNHIYARVAAGEPYEPTKIELSLPDGYLAVGALSVPPSRPYYTGGTTVFEDTVVFTQVISGSGAATINCKVSYQCCNDNRCLPPVETEYLLNVE